MAILLNLVKYIPVTIVDMYDTSNAYEHRLDRGVISARPVATTAKQVRTGASTIQKGPLPRKPLGRASGVVI